MLSMGSFVVFDEKALFSSNHVVSLKRSLQCNNTGTPHLTVEITTVITLASSCNYCNKCTRKLVHLLYEFHSQARGINMVIPQEGVVLPYITNLSNGIVGTS